MKKITAIIFTLLLAFGMTACSQDNEQSKNSNAAGEPSTRNRVSDQENSTDKTEERGGSVD